MTFDLDILKMYPHAKTEVSRPTVRAQTEQNRQTDKHRHTNKHITTAAFTPFTGGKYR